MMAIKMAAMAWAQAHRKARTTSASLLYLEENENPH